MNLEENFHESDSCSIRCPTCHVRARSIRAASADVWHPAADHPAAGTASERSSSGVQHRRRPAGLQQPAGHHARAAAPHPAGLERAELRSELRTSPPERQLRQCQLRTSRWQRPELLAATGRPRAATRLLPAAAGPDGELHRPVPEPYPVARTRGVHEHGASPNPLLAGEPQHHQQLGGLQHAAGPRPDAAERPRSRPHPIHDEHHDQRGGQLLLISFFFAR